MEGQVEACRHVKNWTANVRIRLPEATYNPIHVVYLEEVVEIEFGYILEDRLIMNVPLEQLNLDALRVVIILINTYEALRNLVGNRSHSDRQAAEAISYLIKHVKRQYHNHEWIWPTQ